MAASRSKNKDLLNDSRVLKMFIHKKWIAKEV